MPIGIFDSPPPSGLVPDRLQNDIRIWSVSIFRCFSCHSSSCLDGRDYRTQAQRLVVHDICSVQCFPSSLHTPKVLIRGYVHQYKNSDTTGNRNCNFLFVLVLNT